MTTWLDITFAGHDLVLDADLALYWPHHDALVVSDLHLEKSTFLAQFGSAIAPYDTHDTLNRLEALLIRYRPKTLILLGDSFHDKAAWHRLENDARHRLLDLCTSVGACHLVEGNHDLGLYDAPLNFVQDHILDGIAFRHEPTTTHLPQVIGHFHPKLRLNLHGHRLTGKCFAVNHQLLIMPAFGSFTGGLDLTDDAFTRLASGNPFRPYLIHAGAIAPAPFPTLSRPRRLLP